MEKRLPLALMLCFLIVMGWTVMFQEEPSKRGPAETNVAEVVQGNTADVAGTPPENFDTEERTLQLEFGSPGSRGSYDVLFTNKGGRILSLRLGDAYDREGLSPEERANPDHWVQLLRPVGVPGKELASFGLVPRKSSTGLFPGSLDDALWKTDEIPDQYGKTIGVRFTYGPSKQGVELIKEFRPRPDTHIIDLSLKLKNVSSSATDEKLEFTLTPAVGIASDGQSRFYWEPQVIGAWDDEDELRVEVEEWSASPGLNDLSGAFTSTGDLAFVGVHNKFFACLLQPTDSSRSTITRAVGWRRLPAEEEGLSEEERGDNPYPYLVVDMNIALHLGEVGETRTWDYSVYAGPKAREDLKEASPDFEAVNLEDIGWFTGVGKVILSILTFYQGLVGSWGMAIILMTLTVRLILFPINRRSQTAMARFQTKTKRIQPKIDAIKEKHADNPQKQREEQARLMQEEGAFPPLGGCLPLFLQFPVFIGLFGVLKVEYHLRQEPFLWMRDLSLPDQLMRIDLPLPLFGTIEYLNILPFVMVTMMVLQQSAMPTPTDPQQARMQKMMRWFLVIMGIMLYSYPAGLALYMITSSTLGLFEIKVIKKFWPIDDTEQPVKKGWMMRMAEKQAEQQEAMRRMQQQQKMTKQKAQKNRKKRKR